MQKTVIKVLEAKYNDSMEDWILDDMIQSTLLEFFNWQECCGKGADVQFIQTWDTKSDYYPQVTIEAQFTNTTDAALFSTSFSNLPKKSLQSEYFLSK